VVEHDYEAPRRARITELPNGHGRLSIGHVQEAPPRCSRSRIQMGGLEKQASEKDVSGTTSTSAVRKVSDVWSGACCNDSPPRHATPCHTTYIHTHEKRAIYYSKIPINPRKYACKKKSIHHIKNESNLSTEAPNTTVLGR